MSGSSAILFQVRKAVSLRSCAVIASAFLLGFLLGTEYLSYDQIYPNVVPAPGTSNCISADQKAPLNEPIFAELRDGAVDNSTEARISNLASESSTQNLYISAEYDGRLGNLMFQFSTAYGVARKTGKRVNTFAGSELLSIFPRIREVAYITQDRDSIKRRATIKDPKNCGFVPSVVETARQNKNFTMAGYFQSWRYFDGLDSDIRYLFTFRSDLLAEADKQIASARDGLLNKLRNASANGSNAARTPSCIVYLALHIRRGDFLNTHQVNFGFQVATGDYVRRSLGYFVGKYKSATTALVLLVFGEPSSLEWTRAELPSNITDHIVYVSGNSREQDMAMISRCNATVMTVGSFGWWGAFLSGGETFYYAYPTRPGSSFHNQYVMNDFYLPQWRLFF